jgi:hypothetical protein
MIVVDEYLAVRVLLGQWPEGLPTEDPALPTTRHWRLLQAVHSPRGGQLSRLLGLLPEADQDALRHPRPEILQVLDPRPLLDDAAAIAARYGGTGLLIAETLAAGVRGGLYFGARQNVGRVVARAATDLGINVGVIT